LLISACRHNSHTWHTNSGKTAYIALSLYKQTTYKIFAPGPEKSSALVIFESKIKFTTPNAAISHKKQEN